MPHRSDSTALKQGFSLVELSIVLVIIGLLVGGIAGLRNYTRNAQINTMMNESKILVSAFNQFQTRYNAPPGDFSTASSVWTGAGNGDGNGLIRAATVPLPLERYYAFQHLALGGFIQGTYTGAVDGGGGATRGLNVVASSMDNTAFMFDHPDAQDGFVSADALYFDGNYGNILRIAGVIDGAGAIPALPALNGKQAYQIDDKYDDGMPGTGNIITPESSALANCASTDVTTTAAYVTTSDEKTCYLFIKMQ